MRFAYSKQYSPPALILPIPFRNLGSFDALTHESKVDTGADMTAIPVQLKTRLGLKPYTRRRSKGALDLEYVTMPTFLLEYSLDGSEYVELEVLTTARPYVLLGRDVLKGLVLIADGPKQFFEIKKSAS